MQVPEKKSLESWVALMTHTEIPVLRQTARELSASQEDSENVSARGIADIIAVDPMMTVKLLCYLQNESCRGHKNEVMEVEQALLMMGVDAFFRHVPPQPPLDEVLRGQMAAMVCLLRVVNRSRRASAYALDWALKLRDLRFEEVRIAALLHDLAEMLMWCFASSEMLKIDGMMRHDKALRSHAAQRQVLGFTLDDLQLALAREWALPKLLLTLMDGHSAGQARVRNVVLAVNLARHSANGWDDAALPDDYKDIGALLDMKADDVMMMIGVKEERVCELDTLHH